MFWEKTDAVEEIEELAAMHRQTGNIAQAKSLYTCLIAMIKRNGGDGSEQLAVNFYRLGETYSDEGNYQAAQTYYKRATEIWEKIHPDRELPAALSYERTLERLQIIMETQDKQRNKDQRHQNIA